MVTKQIKTHFKDWFRLILAKIHMVTKLMVKYISDIMCLILAKIYMVTKPQIHNSIYLKTNKS